MRPWRPCRAEACGPWLELDKAKYEGIFKTYPTREEMNLPVQEQLVVEFYSK